MAQQEKAPAQVLHHDPSREKVSATAILIAASRAVESRRPRGERLFEDPYAELLAGEEAVESSKLSLQDAMDRAAPGPGAAPKVLVDPGPNYFPVRTRFIDDAMSAPEGPPQVVIPGAGLDARAWRLPSLAGRVVYELDFPEVLAYKARRMQHAHCLAKDRAAIPVNLGEPGWGEKLAEAGFDKNRPSLWLLEGLLPYLEEPEVARLLVEMAGLSPPGSKLITNITGKNGKVLEMFRFFVERKEDIAPFLEDHGWGGNVQALPASEVAKSYGRPCDYDVFFVVADRKAAAGDTDTAGASSSNSSSPPAGGSAKL